MLAMTLQAMQKGIQRPVSIVPVYIGYENVMEVGSYMKEPVVKPKERVPATSSSLPSRNSVIMAMDI